MFVRPDSPIELPNGQLVCGAHHLVICPYCTVDYSFIEIEEDEPGQHDSDEDDTNDHYPFSVAGVAALRRNSAGGFTDMSIGNETRVGTGKVIPTKFPVPRGCDSPHALFRPGITPEASPPTIRFINPSKPSEFLIFTDGACLNNGAAHPRGGCAFVFKPSTADRPGYLSFQLEEKGPTGESHKHTSNRAELRAVIGASRFRRWDGEGCKSLVFATDSEYVVEGATNWIQGWMRRGWKTSTGEPVKNKDLWQCLLGECERWADNGVKISFWRIPRELNKEADRWAKDAAAKEEQRAVFRDISGILV
ncbi:uncharacterized protein CDV56_108072 [Aspergillus thermomutatus]|uniref:ribonuclease H n=1 Tax=Aspergillus thermomutatus TaxID=41047 RepID=A0A397HJU4_ASPTH|nr:uncharacterized protein CDV56_108072 [Aspergillus thermomutatus]RHZ63237.1 hypothetical protein CDV56_108072 [Aspergillus thermomutatus]